MAREVFLDVSELEPPEPLVLAMAAARDLQAGEYVRMLHRRDPCLLYAQLEEHNYQYRQRKGVSAAVELFIWREDDKEAEVAINKIFAG